MNKEKIIDFHLISNNNNGNSRNNNEKNRGWISQLQKYGEEIFWVLVVVISMYIYHQRFRTTRQLDFSKNFFFFFFVIAIAKPKKDSVGKAG